MRFYGVLPAAHPHCDCVVRYVDIANKTSNPIDRKIDDTQSKAPRFGNVPPLIYDPVRCRSTTYSASDVSFEQSLSAADFRKVFVYVPQTESVVQENVVRLSENCMKSEDLAKTHSQISNWCGFSVSNMQLTGANSRISSSATSGLSNILQGGRFKCQYCNEGFPYQSHLREHERIHTAEKPYQCDICQRRFSQRGSLTVHMRIHLEVKPYHCRVCGKKFRHINSSKRHEKKVHYSGKKHADIQKTKKNEVGKTNHPDNSATQRMQPPLVYKTKPSNLAEEFLTTSMSEIGLTRKNLPIEDNVLCPDKKSCRCKIWKPYLQKSYKA